MTIKGYSDPFFNRVREAFISNFYDDLELGAALSIYIDGDLVVDIWGGVRDEQTQENWEDDTLVNVFSTTKGLTALCCHRLREEGLLDFGQKVSHYWPEFSGGTRDDITVGMCLSHQSGMAAIREDLEGGSLYSWSLMCEHLSKEEPWWSPGRGHGYHPVTFGWLLGEVIRRVTNKCISDVFSEYFALPLNLTATFGLRPEDDRKVARLKQSDVIPTDLASREFLRTLVRQPTGILSRAFGNPPTLLTGGNSRAWRRALLPAVNGHTDATSLAKLYGGLARGGEIEGVHLLANDSLKLCYSLQSTGYDRVLGIESNFSYGFMVNNPGVGVAFGPGQRVFGHPGAGGSLAFADMDQRLGFAYVMNLMGHKLFLDPRVDSIIKALYDCLDNKS